MVWVDISELLRDGYSTGVLRQFSNITAYCDGELLNGLRTREGYLATIHKKKVKYIESTNRRVASNPFAKLKLYIRLNKNE